VAEHHLVLMLNGLDRQEGVAGVLLDLSTDLELGELAHGKQRAPGKHSGKQDKPQKQLCPQSQMGVVFEETFQDLINPCEMNRLPPAMSALKMPGGSSIGHG